MPAALVVNMIQHSRQGGTLTGAGGAGEQHQTSGLFGLLRKNGAQLQRFHGRNLQRKQTQCQSCVALLIESIAAHTDRSVIGHRKVRLALPLQLFLLGIVGQNPDDTGHILFLQDFLSRIHQVAVNTIDRRHSHRQVEVRCAYIRCLIYKFVKIYHAYSFVGTLKSSVIGLPQKWCAAP